MSTFELILHVITGSGRMKRTICTGSARDAGSYDWIARHADAAEIDASYDTVLCDGGCASYGFGARIE